MTRIDFHSKVPDKLLYACRLVRKARSQQMQVVMLAEDGEQLRRLDDALWTFSELDFLPHVRANDPLAAKTPVILTDDDAAELPHYQVLVNLSRRQPANFARFERMFEIIGAAEDDVAAGRERYRQYQQRGYPLSHYLAEQT
jgi:DNA polymerase-3 subunit chi